METTNQPKNPSTESYYFDIDENTDIKKIIDLNPHTHIFEVVDKLTEVQNEIERRV